MKEIFGVRADEYSLQKILEIVKKAIEDKQKVHIVTLNTEMLMAAKTDPSLKHVINKAEIVVPESSGIYLADNFLSAKKGNKIVRLFISTWQTILGKNTSLPTRISGVDLSYLIAGLCSEFGYTLLLLGGGEGVAEEAAKNLKVEFKNLKAEGLYGGLAGSKELVEQVKQIKADVIFVAFGHGRQEKWLAANLNQIPAFVGIGVGGSLDYFAHRVPRAPEVVRNLGLEWAFRLLVQPWRFKRQTSLITFIKELWKIG